MKVQPLVAFLSRRPKAWVHLQQVSFRRLWILLLAVFILFSTMGFYVDLIHNGRLPYVVVLANAVYGGLDAVLWIVVLARLPLYGALLLGLAQLLSSSANEQLAFAIEDHFHPPMVASSTGIHFAATSMMAAVLSSYICFVVYMRLTGHETFRLRTELDLAHSIQRTLVPQISRVTPCFEIFGVSMPSDKVGGDLVDVVELADGDTVAYLADIAGHGLQAGILMGMLKTAARMALLDGTRNQGGGTLSMLMERLNRVLPGVKEAHMYATFSALRLNLDGQAFYGLAASPPLLHWRAAQKDIVRIEEEQFPLALLPVAGFTASPLGMAPGDVVLIATDGISEVCSKTGVEFGTERLEALMTNHVGLPLGDLAAFSFEAVRNYGKQLDDQTLLLVRRSLVGAGAIDRQFHVVNS